MKTVSYVFFYLILSAISFTSCGDGGNSSVSSVDSSASHSTSQAINDINEAELPKGKPVIAEDVNYIPNNNNSNVPLGKITTRDIKNNTTDIKSEQESKEDYLKKKFKSLLVFHADDTMEVNRPKLATLVLSKDETIANIKLKVLEASNATDQKSINDTAIELGSKMKAKLVSFGGSKADNSFEIEALGDDIQSFKADRKKLMWQWKVTPLKPGQQELKLSIQIIEKDDGGINLPTKNIPVIIFAKPESYISEVTGFLKNQYQWIIGIAVAILTTIISTRAKNKNYRQPPPYPDKNAGS